MTLHKNQQIQDFIDDFHLRRADGVISFNAFVSFNIEDQVISKLIEVQIITIVNAETIYFLNSELISPKMPDMLEAKLHDVKYIRGEMLLMKKNADESYIITLKPVI